MSDKLPNCRALVGPWSHNWPDTVVPGPNIAFMDECLRFWDEHLKGVAPGRDMGWAATPLVRWYHCDGVLRPGPAVTSWPGRWRSGPASQGSGRTVFRLGEENKLTSCEESASLASLSRPVSVSFSGETLITHRASFVSRAVQVLPVCFVASGFHSAPLTSPMTRGQWLPITPAGPRSLWSSLCTCSGDARWTSGVT